MTIITSMQNGHHDFVYGGTGDELLTLKINPKDLIKVNEIRGMFG